MSLSRKFNLRVKKILGSGMSRPRPKAIDLARCRKVLVLELWGLGDIVFAASALKALQQQGCGRQVDLLVQPSAKPLMDLLGLDVNPIYCKLPWTEFAGKYKPGGYLRSALWRLIRKLRSNRYDLVLSVREDPRDAFLARLIAPRHSLGYAAFGSGLLLTSSIAAIPSHKTDAWFRLLEFLGVPESAPQALQSLRAGIRARLPRAATGAGRNIVLHCSARNPVRNWGARHFVDLGLLLEKDGYLIRWLSDANSPASAEAPDRWPKLAGNLAEIVTEIAAADLYFGNDGGLMHIADLFGARICAVFGPTDPAMFFPYGQPDSLVYLPLMPCRPCFDYCIFPKPICFDGITAERVHGKILGLLTASPFDK